MMKSHSGVWVLGLIAACACSSGSDERSSLDGKVAPNDGKASTGIGDGEIGNGAGPAGADSPSLAEGTSDAFLEPSTSTPAGPSPTAGAAPGLPAPSTPAGLPPSGSTSPGASAGSDGAFIDGFDPGPGAAAPPPSDEAPIDFPLLPPIADPGDPEAEPAPPKPTNSVKPGTLTAGTWDDNLNFERFLDYRDEVTQHTSGTLPFDEDEHVEANERSGQLSGKDTLDISLVIDTTGSMGDELRYLQTEFLALSESIEARYPNSEQRWSLVVYRDVGDEYEARWFDFRDDPQEFRKQLSQQAAGGGGDFPEAPERAFEAMNQLAWRTDDATARLAFWVADAPHHAQRASELADALRTTQALDIHVYPVASSGVDELTELSMRSAAQLTLGRYLFLTDDSGVGGAHKEPSIPCYFVTQLDTAILRMVDIEMSGVYREPSADEIIRASGDPQDRACTLQSGTVLWAY